MTPTFGEVIGVIGGVLSLLLAVIGFLWRHGQESEKALMQSRIDDAHTLASRATDKLLDGIEARHKLEIAIEQLRAVNATLIRDVDELRAEDSSQGKEIGQIRSRLDRGQRTRSQQMPIQREDDDSVPPDDPGPMRPRLPSRRG